LWKCGYAIKTKSTKKKKKSSNINCNKHNSSKASEEWERKVTPAIADLLEIIDGRTSEFQHLLALLLFHHYIWDIGRNFGVYKDRQHERQAIE
jgi:hypothetical protein